MQPVVAKLGGNALGSLPDALALGADGRQLVIVHGGGAQISALMRRRGIEPRFVGGRRFTDLPSLACVRKALADVSDELAAAIAATSSSETSPSALRTHASDGRSVNRRPPTKRGSMPRRRISAEICAPPPWTITSCRPPAPSARASAREPRAFPPSLATTGCIRSCTPSC